MKSNSDLGYIIIYDIETLKENFLYMDKEPGEGEWHSFILTHYQNELDGLVKYLKDTNIDYMVQFNGNRFDWQVLQFILDNNKKWFNLTNQEILKKIYEFAQDIIHNQNYEILPPYKERYFDRKQIDLFSIMGYENENKRTSLKWIEFSLDMEVEEMPINHWQTGLTQEDIEIVKEYCQKDILATEALYNLVRGNTTNTLYQGEDMIGDTLELIREEEGLHHTAINYSEVRLGEELNLLGYMKEAKLTRDKLWERKRKQKPRSSFTFGDCMPKYIQFQTKPFKDFHNLVKKQPFKFHDKQEFPFIYNQTTYTIMKGGLHSVDFPRIIEAKDGIVVRTADIGSQYPNSINKRGLFPIHLGPEWNTNYGKNTRKRIEFKSKGKTEKKYKGLAKKYKLALNGGGFGKLNDTFSVQYDPFPHFSCTIGNQFEILMLIEMLELKGFTVLSANTDGITTIFPQEKTEEYYYICNEWEKIVGNDIDGKLEYCDVSKIIQTSVNDYIEVAVDGTIKMKGDFCVDVEINKNKSRRIVPIALLNFFTKGIPVDTTIQEHDNIFDFCIAKKASKDYSYEGIDRNTGKVTKYNRLIRYFISTEGEKIWKVKNESSEKTGPVRSQCESTAAHQVLFNKPFRLEKFEDYKIDHSYYIQAANKIIDQILPVYACDRKNDDRKQLSLF